jgi:MATE family multidrug resistance protein
MQDTLAGLAPIDMRALWRAEIRALLALGLPLAGSQLAHIAISTTSVVMLGWLGADALAAGGLGFSVYFAPFMFCNGVAVAAAPLVSQAIGRRDEPSVKSIVAQGFWASSAVGLAVAIPMWFAAPILLLIGQDPRVTTAAEPFIQFMALGLVPALWFTVLRSLIAALGHPRVVMYVMMTGFALNAALSYVLIFGKLGVPQLGVAGSAMATASTNVFMFAALFLYARFAPAVRRFHATARLAIADWPRFREVLHVGVPIGGSLVLEIGLFSACVLLMGLIGPVQIAAHQIAVQCAAITFMVPLGLAQGATIRVGYAAGRGDGPGLRRAGRAALALAVAFMSVMTVLLATFPRSIAKLFVDASDPANAPVLDLAAAFLIIAAIFQLVDGVQAVAAGTLRGLKDTRIPMLLSGLGYWGVGFTACVVLGFPLGLGGIGIWIGLALGIAAAAVLLVSRFERLSARVGTAAP